jgi:hypothetical protein
MPEFKPYVYKLIDKVIDDFSKQLSLEKDLSIILLKGHLLIEYYLNYLIILTHDQEKRVDNLSFYEKIEILENDKCIKTRNIIPCLRQLNNVRNNLSHELNYIVSESEIDSIGFLLGKKYIFKKFDIDCHNTTELRELFMWVINKVLFNVFLPIFSAIK